MLRWLWLYEGLREINGEEATGGKGFGKGTSSSVKRFEGDFRIDLRIENSSFVERASWTGKA